MRVRCAAVSLLTLLTAAATAAAGQSAGQAPSQQATPPPPAGQGPVPAPGQAGAPAAPAPTRTFTAPVGLLFNAVRADRVGDFEKVLGYLQAALDKSSDPAIRAQAMGWRMFKAAEPGPGGTVLYVFAIDPTVPGADYGLGRILAEAYPDAAQLQEIWRLYQGAVTSGGSLLNLTPVMPAVPAPPSPGVTSAPGVAPPAEATPPPAAAPSPQAPAPEAAPRPD